jgi:Holliday junction DNA helicase RuvA
VIGFLHGQVAGVTADGCFLDVGGVGYRLTCSSTTRAALPATGRPCRLWTHLHVREDALSLFGFATEAEQAMFEGLLAVSGIGPKVALGVCSAFSPDSFRRVVLSDDVAALASVPGLGRKTAQRILLELRDRLAAPPSEAGDGDALAAARSALANLGYAPAEIRAALEAVAGEPQTSVEDAVRSALKVLA